MEQEAKVDRGAGQIQPKAARGDRFFYGYLLVAVSFLLQAIGWGAYNSFGVFFNPLMNEYGWSRAGISGTVSVSFIMCGLASIVMGRLNDRVVPSAPCWPAMCLILPAGTASCCGACP